MNETKYYVIHEDYVEVIFTDDMTSDELHAVHMKSDETAAKWLQDERQMLVLVDLSQATKHNLGQFKEKVQMLDTEGLKAVAIYGQEHGLVHNVVASVVSSYSSVLPIKFFSEKNEALGWLRSIR